MANAGGAAASEIEWKTNPFNGNFNPGTKTGQVIFIEKTKGHPDGKRFDLSKEHSSEIHQFFKTRSASLGGCCLIPIAFDGTGTATEWAHLITQHSKTSLKQVQWRGHKRFSTALAVDAPIPNAPFTVRNIDPASNDGDKTTFYDRVDGSVLAKLIENILTPMGYQDLLLQKESFEFTNPTTGETHFDGPTMLKIIFTIINPDTIVGMDSLKAQLETMKLHEHGNDVSKMLTKMQSIYRTLKENGHAPDSYRRYVYTALKTGPNSDFNAFMDRIVDDIQSGCGYNKNITTDELILAARTKYHNMVEDKSWSKVDPRDAKILALTTKLEKIEKEGKASANATNGTNPGGSNPTNTHKLQPLDEWRKKFDGAKKEVAGRTYYWCKHHKSKDYDGLYVTSHSEEHHEAWSKDKKDRTGKYRPAEDAKPKDDKPAGPASSAPKSSLGLTDRLKQVLMTDVMLSEGDVDKIFKAAQAN